MMIFSNMKQKIKSCQLFSEKNFLCPRTTMMLCLVIIATNANGKRLPSNSARTDLLANSTVVESVDIDTRHHGRSFAIIANVKDTLR